MKIEKISENQIRCTLSHQDLAERELKISELAYGTEKAKALFRDMMQQASFQFGFETDDIPLMIEAIPISRETLILVITKVEDPDELDTRFSKFSPEAGDNNDDETLYQNEETSGFTDELLNRYDQLSDMIDTDNEHDESFDEDDNIMESNEANEKSEFIPLAETLGFNKKTGKNTDAESSSVTDIVKIFSFKTLDDVTQLACHISTTFTGINSIYKNTTSSSYYLVMHKTEHSPEEFSRICNIASEYGTVEKNTYATACHFDEHLEPIIKDKAIQVLSSL